MKKFLSAILLLSLFLPSAAFSQSKNIKAGIKALQAWQYDQAMKEFDAALSDPGAMKDKDLAQAYYYRGKTQLDWLNKQVTWKGLAEKEEKRVMDYGLNANKDLLKARKHDTDKKLGAEIKAAGDKASFILEELAWICLNEAKLDYTPEDRKKTLAERALAFGKTGVELDKFNYMPYSLKGEAHLLLGNDAEALKAFRLVDDTFFRSAPKSGDPKIGYAYIHLAHLEQDLNKDTQTAMDILAKGRKKVDGENLKIQSLGNRRPDEKAKYHELYTLILSDLSQAEREIQKKAGK